MTDAAVSSIRLPSVYGSPTKHLEWEAVRLRLEQAPQYWLATTRPDGRPHVVPVDGLWAGDRWYFGGAPDTVWQLNLRTNPEIAVFLPDPTCVVIAEGTARLRTPTRAESKQLTAASRTKYGYAPPASAYAAGVWALAPRRVLAWNSLGEDATRFDFDPACHLADRGETRSGF